jgi:hypothetical protein
MITEKLLQIAFQKKEDVNHKKTVNTPKHVIPKAIGVRVLVLQSVNYGKDVT